jgi:hypothetical protein
MAAGVHVQHIAEWAGGRYDKAHYHMGGAILLIVRGVGFSLMWPKELGVRPFESGHGEQVVRVDWREGSLLSPPTDWFHEHFNTGTITARQLAFRTGGKYVLELSAVRHGKGTNISTREGGTLIEREDEDPEIRRIFERACADNGTPVDMPRVAAPLTV